MKTFYIASAAALAFFIGLKLRVPVKFLSVLGAGTILYLSYPVLQRRFNFYGVRHSFTEGSFALQAPPSLHKIILVASIWLLFLFAVIRLHLNLKLLLLPFAAGTVYLLYPILYGLYYQNALPAPQEDNNPLAISSLPAEKNPVYWALGIIAGFVLSFELHIKFLMYPLGAAIFYLYLPLLYSTGKKYALQYTREGQPANYIAYFWFTTWFISCCFFSYMLAHLITDILASFNLHIFRYLLIGFSLLAIAGCLYIWLLQKASRKIAVLEDIHTNYEKQGQLANFIVFLLLMSYFLVKH